LTPLLNAGYTGAGQTIIIIDSFGSPTIANDLSTFDAGYGLPAPPSFTVLAPLGTASFDPSDSDQVGWASETTLDVEWAHALAPGAGIVLLTSPVSETEGVQGLPEFLQLEQYALDHHLGKIISQSWGATENTLFDPAGQQVMADFERFYLRAALENVTILASTGDSGSANIDISGNYYPFPTVEFPASSPLVTAVGGTSEGAPQWAGIIADGNQLAGHPLGFLNLRLYLLRGMGFHDVTTGNNSFHGVPGYNATPGWDLATGWGTPNLSRLLWVLARQQ
jgi:subtilase family serine protease